MKKLFVYLSLCLFFLLTKLHAQHTFVFSNEYVTINNEYGSWDQYLSNNWTHEANWDIYPGSTIHSGDTVIISDDAYCQTDIPLIFESGSVLIIQNQAEIEFNQETINNGIIVSNGPNYSILAVIGGSLSGNFILYNYSTLISGVANYTGKIYNYGFFYCDNFPVVFTDLFINDGDLYTFFDITNTGLFINNSTISFGTEIYNQNQLINYGEINTISSGAEINNQNHLINKSMMITSRLYSLPMSTTLTLPTK